MKKRLSVAEPRYARLVLMVAAATQLVCTVHAQLDRKASSAPNLAITPRHGPVNLLAFSSVKIGGVDWKLTRYTVVDDSREVVMQSYLGLTSINQYPEPDLTTYRCLQPKILNDQHAWILRPVLPHSQWAYGQSRPISFKEGLERLIGRQRCIFGRSSQRTQVLQMPGMLLKDFVLQSPNNNESCRGQEKCNGRPSLGAHILAIVALAYATFACVGFMILTPRMTMILFMGALLFGGATIATIAAADSIPSNLPSSASLAD